MINFEWQAKIEPPCRGIVLENQAEIDPVRHLLAHADTSQSLGLLHSIDGEIITNHGLEITHLNPFDSYEHVLAFYMKQTLSPDQKDALLDIIPLAKTIIEGVKLPQIILEGVAYKQLRDSLGSVSLSGIGIRDKRKIKNLTGSAPSSYDVEILGDIRDRIDQSVRAVDCPVDMEGYRSLPYVVTANPKEWLERRFNIIANKAIAAVVTV